MNATTPTMATAVLRQLLVRCTETNSTPAFRSAIQQGIGCLIRGDLTSARTIIDQTCANVSGKVHECSGHYYGDGGESSPPCLLQADEEQTGAYSTLDGLRFGFGFLYLRELPSNVMVLG